jgi:hypothetical protein
VTLVELMISTIISAMILAGAMAAVISVARHERNAMFKHAVLTRSRRVEDGLQRILRNKYRDQINFLSPYVDANGITFFRGVEFRAEKDGTVERLRFDGGDLTYDPNVASAGGERLVGGPNTLTQLVEVGFRQSLEASGARDQAGMMKIKIVVDDGGRVRQRDFSKEGLGPYAAEKWLALQIRGTR